MHRRKNCARRVFQITFTVYRVLTLYEKDKQGGEAICNTSLNRSCCCVALEIESDDSDDEVVVTSHCMAEPANVDTL
jgi:hypothetical protein